MRQIVVGNPFHGSVIAHAAGRGEFDPEAHRVVAMVDGEGSLMGGTVFTEWTGEGGSIQMHVAAFADRWITPDLLWATFAYPFLQLKVAKVVGRVRGSNKAALDFDLKLGFKLDARLPDVYPGGEADLWLSMYGHECRHLRIRPRGTIVTWGVTHDGVLQDQEAAAGA